MEWTKFLVGGAALGVMVGLWKQIKALVWKILSLFVQEVEINDATITSAVVGHLMSTHRRLGPITRTYAAAIDYHLRDGQRRLGNIAYERFGSRSLWFRRGPWPLYYHAASGSSTATYPEVQASSQQRPSGGSGSSGAKLYFLRGTFDSDRLIAEAVKAWNQIGWELADQGGDSRRRFFIKYLPSVTKEKSASAGTASSWQYFNNIRLLDLSPRDVGIGARRAKNMLDRLFFPDELQPLIEEVKTWRKSQDWFEARGIPWKRGWLLHGKPGTGKTALASAFAYDLDLPIFVFNLAEMTNAELMSDWRGMLASAPCIALIEDMDAVFHGRDNVAGRRGGGGEPESEQSGGQRGMLSFDVLLNCIDGVDRAEGVFTIITTNRVELIDHALGQPVRRADGNCDFVSTRPGRIDRAIELAEMKPYVKKRMAAHILEEFPDEYDAMVRHIDAHADELETPAQFQQRCNQIALDRFWARAAGNGQAKGGSAPSVATRPSPGRPAAEPALPRPKLSSTPAAAVASATSVTELPRSA